MLDSSLLVQSVVDVGIKGVRVDKSDFYVIYPTPIHKTVKLCSNLDSR